MLKNKFKITEAELEVLKVIWKNSNITSKEIVNALLDKTEWKSKTIQTLINRLLCKGVLAVDKTSKKAYIYSSNISEDEYKKIANESFVNKLYNGSINLMISSYIKENKLSRQDIEDLKDLLNDEN